MEKSSLNIKSFRNLLSNQNKNYKISPKSNHYHPTEVKLNGLNGSIDDSTGSCNIEELYSIKRAKSEDSECSKRNSADVICGNWVKFFSNYNSSFCLTVLTPVACSVSVIIIVAAIAGPLWITTEEKIPWLTVNTSLYRGNYTFSYIIKSSNASLWILCTRQALDDNRTKLDFNHKNCSRINYFSMESYQQDLRDPTNESNNVIPYTITLSAPLLIIAFIILLISYLLFLLAICSHKYKIFYFAAGIGFIISGLLSLSGLIMFISIFKSEVYHKLRPESQSKELLFHFNYGQSFFLYVIGFVVVELSGILNVCLFNKLQKQTQQSQNQFQLNNYVKVGVAKSESSAAPKMCQHRVAFPSIVENGYLPQQNRCSLHTMSNNRKSVGDGLNNLLSTQHSQQVPSHFVEFNHLNFSTPFKRNASTSTLDLVGEKSGDSSSGKNNQRALNITKDKSSFGNKLDFNSICGMMRSSSNKLNKETNMNENIRRLKPAKNIYYIEERKDDEPNIFIIDPSTINKHKKIHQMQKYLEDIRIHKTNNQFSPAQGYNSDCDAKIGWNFMDRNYYGSRTLPRDFSRRNIRPSLDNLLDSFHQHANDDSARPTSSSFRRCSNIDPNNIYPPPTGFNHHHSSCDELSMNKPSRNVHFPNDNVTFVEPPKAPQEYQWPKFIPKSPSSFSMNSFRLQRQPPPFIKCPNYNHIDEFDLDKIEHELVTSGSHSTLFKENVNEFGTAV